MELDTSIECVLFDLDGTLIDTALDFIKALDRLTAENNQPPVKDLRVQQTVSDGARALIKLAFDITENDDRFASLNQRLLDLYLEQLRILKRRFTRGSPTCSKIGKGRHSLGYRHQQARDIFTSTSGQIESSHTLWRSGLPGSCERAETPSRTHLFSLRPPVLQHRTYRLFG